MAAPKDTTHSIKSCYRCGKEFTKPCGECEVLHCKQGRKCTIGKAMNIAPAKENRLMHVALCDECYAKDGIWWVGKAPKYRRVEDDKE